jgi:hypothetical protein
VGPSSRGPVVIGGALPTCIYRTAHLHCPLASDGWGHGQSLGEAKRVPDWNPKKYPPPTRSDEKSGATAPDGSRRRQRPPTRNHTAAAPNAQPLPAAGMRAARRGAGGERAASAGRLAARGAAWAVGGWEGQRRGGWRRGCRRRSGRCRGCRRDGRLGTPVAWRGRRARRSSSHEGLQRSGIAMSKEVTKWRKTARPTGSSLFLSLSLVLVDMCWISSFFLTFIARFRWPDPCQWMNANGNSTGCHRSWARMESRCLPKLGSSSWLSLSLNLYESCLFVHILFIFAYQVFDESPSSLLSYYFQLFWYFGWADMNIQNWIVFSSNLRSGQFSIEPYYTFYSIIGINYMTAYICNLTLYVQFNLYLITGGV